jgi:sec-independent protein translocase protein TatC
VVATAIAAVFSNFLLRILEYPLKAILAKHNHIISTPIITSPTELVTIPLKVAMVGGLIISLPVVIWQVWGFVSPGLRPAERRLATPLFASALLLFSIGACLSYFLMPIFLNILVTIVGSDAIYFPDLGEYLSFVCMLIVAFGLTFELPVVIVLLGALGVVSSTWLRRRRKVVWLVTIIAAELVTPGVDPVTPLFLAVPLIGLFELSILVLAKALKR